MKLIYRPEIDGVRAIAVIAVILYHAQISIYEYQPFKGGFIGVDIFFVISGYLITSIIIKDYENGTFTFKNFWMRRIRRILPVLLALVIVVSFTAIVVTYAADLNTVGQQGLAALFSFSNINFWISSGSYWGASAEASPYLHTWSLSVEEQFYVFFPLVLILLMKL